MDVTTESPGPVSPSPNKGFHCLTNVQNWYYWAAVGPVFRKKFKNGWAIKADRFENGKDIIIGTCKCLVVVQSGVFGGKVHVSAFTLWRWPYLTQQGCGYLPVQYLICASPSRSEND